MCAVINIFRSTKLSVIVCSILCKKVCRYVIVSYQDFTMVSHVTVIQELKLLTSTEKW